VFFSKALLRHPQARSTLSEMSGESVFQRYLPESHPESLVEPEKIRRHILCSGQVYYQLLKEREEKGHNDVAISRLEQLSPLPYDLLTPHLDKYPNADLVWAQEEPLNNGAWTYVQPRLITALKETKSHADKVPIYAGRKPSSSVATGSKQAHKNEIAMINEMAFSKAE
jgi:2-oxoglutarate dehydrogenase E1 component